MVWTELAVITGFSQICWRSSAAASSWRIRAPRGLQAQVVPRQLLQGHAPRLGQRVVGSDDEVQRLAGAGAHAQLRVGRDRQAERGMRLVVDDHAHDLLGPRAGDDQFDARVARLEGVERGQQRLHRIALADRQFDDAGLEAAQGLQAAGEGVALGHLGLVEIEGQLAGQGELDGAAAGLQQGQAQRGLQLAICRLIEDTATFSFWLAARIEPCTAAA